MMNKITPFQQKVFKAVMAIPLGEVRTYKWVAQKIGRPRAAQAVGQALNRNPYTIIIPCHRVVASSGAIGGYSLGVLKKKRLLNLEKKIYNSLKIKSR